MCTHVPQMKYLFVKMLFKIINRMYNFNYMVLWKLQILYYRVWLCKLRNKFKYTHTHISCDNWCESVFPICLCVNGKQQIYFIYSDDNNYNLSFHLNHNFIFIQTNRSTVPYHTICKRKEKKTYTKCKEANKKEGKIDIFCFFYEFSIM